MFYLVTFIYIILVIWAVKEVMSGDNKKYLIAKTTASFGFVVLGLYAFFVSHSELYLSFVSVYILCFLGDVLLGVAHEKKQFFIPGMLFFLCSHFVLIGIFLGMRNEIFGAGIHFILASVIVGTLTLISSFFPKWMDYGHKKVPVIIYAYTVGMCGGCGLDLLLENIGGNIGYIMLGFGAFIFMISDCILCLKYFKVNKKKWHPPLVTTTYYIALYLISMFYLYI